MIKERFNTFIKWVLFLLAYYPLFLIIAIKNSNIINNLTLNNFKNISINMLNDTFIYILLLGIIILLILFPIVHIQKDANKVQYKVVCVKDISHETLSYIVTYIIAFLSFDLTSLTNILSILILLFIIGLIYTNSNLLYINPVLQVFGYSILDVVIKKNSDIAEEKNVVIITKNRYKYLKKGEFVNLSLVNDGLKEIYLAM